MEKDYFLNEKHREIKQKIIKELIEVVNENINENINILKNINALCDLIGSILILFNEEMLISFSNTFNCKNQINKLMENIFKEITNKVKEELKL